MDTLVIRPADVGEAVRFVGARSLFKRVIDELDHEWRTLSSGDERLPARSGFVTDREIPSVLEWMPYAGADQDVTIKVVAYNPANARRRLPTVVASIAVYDGATGHLHTLLDGVALTAIRTGAASALATRILSRSESTVLGIVGAGAQAVAQVLAIGSVRPIDRVLVFDRDGAAASSLGRRCQIADLSIQVAPLTEVEENADILCTATSVGVGEGPVIADRVAAHAHINAVGSDLPGKIELPESLLRRAFVTPDFPEQAAVEGECQRLSSEQIGPPLADLVRDPDQFAYLREELTVFDSTGMGLQDHVVSRVIREIVSELGLGVRVPLQHFGSDPSDPFDFAASPPFRGADALNRVGPTSVGGRPTTR